MINVQLKQGEVPIYDKLPDTIIVVDEAGEISKVNGQFTSMFGYEKSELIGQPVEILMPEGARAGHKSHLRTYKTKPSVRSMGSMSNFDLFAQRKDGSEFPVDIMLSPVSTATGTLVVAVIRDITERFKIKEKLKNLAYCDQLTNLPNWACLLEDLEIYLKQSSGPSLHPISIGILKVDGFNDVNVTLGYLNGDHLIKKIAQRLTKAIAGKTQLYRKIGRASCRERVFRAV